MRIYHHRSYRMTTIGSARRSAQLAALVVAVVLVALAFLLALVFPAHAHDKWADGTAVPAWVKASCCGPNDAHMDPRLGRTETGYRVDDLLNVVPFDRVLPSQDGHVWAFYNPDSGPGALVFCLFIPMSM